MIKMENDVLSVEIAEHGAELTKLYNKKQVQIFSGMQNPNFGNVIHRCYFQMWEKPIRTQ